MGDEIMEPGSQHTNNKEVSYGLGIRHLQVTMMGLGNLMLFMLRSCLGVAVLHMTDQSQADTTNSEVYNWDEKIRGVVLSSFFWGYVVMQIPSGVLASKYGAKPLVLAALLLSGTFCLLTPFMAKLGGWQAVCVIRVAMGFTQACLFPCTQTFLGKWAPPQERSIMNTISTIGVELGVIITMPMCGVLASTFIGWRLIFYTMGSLAYIVAIIFWIFTASSPEQHRLVKEAELEYIQTSLNSISFSKSPRIPWKKILTSIPIYAIAITHAAALGWTYTFMFVQLPTYLKQGLGLDLRDSAILSALPFVSKCIGQVVASYLGDYIYKRKVMSTTNTRRLFNSLGSFGTGGCFIILGLLDRDHKYLALCLTISAMGLLGTIYIGFVLNHLDLTPNFAGVTYSITNSFTNFFSILAPMFTGFVLGDDPTNPLRWRIIFFVAAAILIFSNIIYIIFIKTEIQPWNEPQDSTQYHLGTVNKESLTNDHEVNSYTFNEPVSDKRRL